MEVKSVRDQIIIHDNQIKYNLDEFSDIQLALVYSNNKNNFEIFKKLLSEINNKKIFDKLLIFVVSLTKPSVNIDAIKLLIEFGANINTLSSTLKSSLNYCCMDPIFDIEIIEFLIENGTNINIKSHYNETPLMQFVVNCSVKDDLKIIRLLIRKGSKINHKVSLGTPLLMICFESKYNIFIRCDIIKILLDNKADIYVQNKKGDNIFDIVNDRIGINSDIYSLIFNYKNINNDDFCEYDIKFIYNYL